MFFGLCQKIAGKISFGHSNIHLSNCLIQFPFSRESSSVCEDRTCLWFNGEDPTLSPCLPLFSLPSPVILHTFHCHPSSYIHTFQCHDPPFMPIHSLSWRLRPSPRLLDMCLAAMSTLPSLPDWSLEQRLSPEISKKKNSFTPVFSGWSLEGPQLHCGANRWGRCRGWHSLCCRACWGMTTQRQQ